MKQTGTIIALMMCLMPLAAHTYVPHSMLNHGHIVKMRVAESGIYKVTYDEIKAQGLNPEKTGVLGYGGGLLSQDFRKDKIDDVPQVAVYRSLGADGIFNSGDYLLFYAQGPVSWKFNNSYFVHTQNHCSSYGYYFLSDADEALYLMPIAEQKDTTNAIRVNDYTYYEVHEKDLVNLLDIAKGEDGGGQEFYGESMRPNTSMNVQLHVPQASEEGKMTCLVTAASTVTATSTVQIQAGESSKSFTILPLESSKDFYTKAQINQARLSDIAFSSNQNVRIHFKTEGTAGAGYLNYVEINAECLLKMRGNQMAFRNAKNNLKKENNLFVITDGANAQVWDITHLDAIQRMETFQKGTDLCFADDNQEVHEYIAVNTNTGDYPSPAFIGKVENQDLHAMVNKDLVIVCPTEFKAEAYRLGEAHWQKDELSYAVVTDQEVYNEFSSGTPDVSAIRWMMKMLYDRAKKGESSYPRYLLLMGDGTFDNRKLLPTSGKNTLLTYQAANSTVETKAYASDDYFGFLEDGDGMIGTYFADSYGTMEIGVGRLPVNTQEEARNMVDKLEAYILNPELGKWQQQICFLADDGDHNQHTNISDEAAEMVRQKAPDFIINKIYLDSYTQEKTASTESYPLAFNRYTNLLKTGVLFMNYTGHGSANNICSEQFLTLKSVQGMSNHNQGFWMLATCSYAHFDKATISSAEAAVLNPHGGAIGVMSACRTVWASENKKLNTYLCDTLFSHQDDFTYDMRLGDAVRCAKNRCGVNENKLAYVFLGDPALRLNYPTGYRVVSTTKTDTLRALQTVSMTGYVENSKQDTVTDFNGIVHVAIYDKMQQVTTRDNDEPNPQKKITYTYNDYPNLLFMGSTPVIDGRFTFEFRMPKDINYIYGNGRIVYCAIDTTADREGIGHNHGFIVGGSDTAVTRIQDTIGPNLFIYLDNPSFQSGGKTSENPHFFAIIDDENGINTIGNGIGHDLQLMIDNDMKQTYILNEYFLSSQGSYKQGSVSYTLPTQKPGQHFLQFRAWDMLNNSNTAKLSYQVVEGLNPQLYSIKIYPNPSTAGDLIKIAVDTDRPDERLMSTLDVYSITGQRVVTIDWTEERTLTFCPAEHHLTAGIYILQLRIKTPQSGTTTSKSKLIIL